MTSAGKQASWKGLGETKLYRLGYVWWLWGDYCGGLEYVRFKHQNFFAPDAKVTAFGYAFEPGVEGILRPVYSKLDAFDPKVLGQALNLAAGRLGALRQLGIEGFEGPAIQMTALATNKRLLEAKK
jgi:hypothetical protein